MIPSNPKIYHIVHKDRLLSILQDGYLLSDAVIRQKNTALPMIGMQDIKDRRLTKSLNRYSDLTVGQCVPFYFCPRSIMLYLIHQRNLNLQYQNGQDNIIHLQADFYQVINWANTQSPKVRWVFTTSNAGSNYFEDYNQLSDLNKINWNAVNAKYWSDPYIKEGKQAEFLIEQKFPIHLIEQIGVYNQSVYGEVRQIIQNFNHQMQTNIQIQTNICPDWYY